MRVLLVNKFHYLRGGSERYYFDLEEALRQAGHEVITFSMQHARNRPSAYTSDFVSYVDFHAEKGIRARLATARRFVYSEEARDRLEALVARTRPHVAHLHNIAHQLTPSILEPLAAARVPIVQTLHDYKLICSSYLLFANGSICERCRTGHHVEAVRQRCHHGSLAKSFLGFVEMSWHVHRKSYARVRTFLCPSRFMREKCIEFGVHPERLVHLPYFLPLAAYEPAADPGAYALYAGRLSREKGVATLVAAAGKLRGHRLVVLGEGPLREELERTAASTGAPIEFRGYVDPIELRRLVRDASFVIVPSEWHENLPYAVLEAFALGKPVLGSRVGGIPELVRDGETGALFPPGDAEALASAWRALASSNTELTRMGRNARRLMESDFGPSDHVERLTSIYRSVAA